jgi:predicted transcriptional regulator
MSQDDSTIISPEVEARARNIHSALSNGDSLRIFNLAAEGIDASTSVLEKYQFTKKRYYGRLKELVDLGLIAKEDGEYRHTALGNLVFESQVKDLEQILLKRNNVTVIVEMKRDNRSLMNQVIPRDLIMDIENSTGVPNLEPVKFFDNWNDLSMDVSIEIEMMKKDFCVASRYVDFRTADAALRAAKKGCKVTILHSPRNGLSTKFQLMGNLMTHPKALSVFKELTTHPGVTLHETTIPYSFLVIDNQIVGLEIVNPEDPYSFFFGLKFRNEGLANKLVSHFEALVRNSEKDSIAAVIESNKAALEKPQSSNQLLTT